MILNKYLVALLSIALVAVNGLQAALEGGLDLVEALQLIPVIVAAIISYLVPLVNGPWAGALKTGLTVLAAAAAAIIPFATVGFIEPSQVMIVIYAALQALAVEVGVNVRKDDLRLAA